MKDVLTQLGFVIDAVDRMLMQIDQDPLSPTYGCAHLAYWRDKTSDVADMRRQEVMLPFSLLYSHKYPGSGWQGNERIRKAVESLLLFWCRNRYSDGSMDEWYKGERGYAVAAFSAHAVARTLETMTGTLPEYIVSLSKRELSKTAYWLTARNDLFKTNHQAVSVTALAWAARILNDDVFERSSREKLRSIIAVQTKEGWFPEIGHMDVGYTFLTVEFVAMAMELWDDWRDVGVFQRAFDFACEWIHPDLTVGVEYGVCHNPYLSRIAILLMAKHSSRAAHLWKRLENESAGMGGVESVFSDDLRLLRWSYQPLLCYDYAQRFQPERFYSKEAHQEIKRDDRSVALYKEASLVRFSISGCSGVLAGAAGGMLRLFGNAQSSSISDYGYAISTGNGFATNLTYDRRIEIENRTNGYGVKCNICPAKKIMPSSIARVLLSVACSTALGSSIARKAIDIVRKKKGTSINQASFNLSARRSPWFLFRLVSFENGSVHVTDRIDFKRAVDSTDMFFLESIDKDWMHCRSVVERIPGIPRRLRHMEIRKIYRPGEKWQLSEIASRQ